MSLQHGRRAAHGMLRALLLATAKIRSANLGIPP